jgi:hypothetical protein
MNRLKKGIQLPAFDIEMLNLGKLIVVPYKQYLSQDQEFFLYPSSHLPLGMKCEEYYKDEYIDKAKVSLSNSQAAPIPIRSWARTNFDLHLYDVNKGLLDSISTSTIWRQKALERILDEHGVLRILFLRVFKLSNVFNFTLSPPLGDFCWAEEESQIFGDINVDFPIVSAGSFKMRKHQIISGEVYPYTELEKLNIELYSENQAPHIRKFSESLKSILGWSYGKGEYGVYPDWMTEITSLGNRSKEEDAGISNYQAGTDFENIVRKSLEFLGFKVDYAHKGGAGGLDLFCSKPYSLVGECKSGKRIPNDTAVQLLNLGTLRLENKKEFDESVKLIIGPGTPTEQLNKAAKVHNMAVINPSTLEKLVQLHYRHPIDLLKLKNYFINGQSDEEVNQFISQTYQDIELRSHIVKLIKNYQENANSESADLSSVHAIHIVSQPLQPLKREEIHDILVELSSPLTGYLGRVKGQDWKDDRFYFLRDLTV